MAKKKKAVNNKGDVDSTPSSRTDSRVPSPISVTGDTTVDDVVTKEEKRPVYPFKNPLFEVKKQSRKKVWKGLKQILTQERSLQWPEDAVLYSHMDAPPSFRPAKKYSDLSGLPAKYTDPQTQLRYSFSDEFQTIRTLPSDIVAGYLALRKASNIVG